MFKKITAILSVLTIAIVSLTTTSCYFDKEDVLYPDTSCDTTRLLSYSSDIVPVLSINCYNCHSQVNAPIYGEGLVLEGYPNLRRYFSSTNLI